MKVVHINSVYGIRSTGSFIADLHNSANAEGIESYCFVGERTNIKRLHEKNVYAFNYKLLKKLHALFSRIFGLQAYFSFFETSILISKLRKIKPHVVHLHNLHDNYINLPLLLKFLSKEKIATVITLHDCWFFTGKCTHFVDVNCYKWKTKCGGCPKLSDDNTSWFFDFTYFIREHKEKLLSDIPKLLVVGVSDWLTDQARESFFKNFAKITRIYNWIDDRFLTHPKTNSYFSCSDLSPKFNPNLKTIILVASVWSDAKGQNELIELIERNDYSKFNIIVVGKTDKREITNGRNIWIDEIHDIEYLISLYDASDIFINLSKLETFGKVNVEAACRGLVVYSYQSTGNTEITKLIGGHFISNIEGLINELSDFSSEKKNVIDIIKLNFCKDLIVKLYFDEYRKLQNEY